MLGPAGLSSDSGLGGSTDGSTDILVFGSVVDSVTEEGMFWSFFHVETHKWWICNFLFSLTLSFQSGQIHFCCDLP